MKPIKILIFILTTTIILAVLSFVFPEKGILITDDFSLDFVTFDELINPQKQEKVDISDIIENTTVDDNEIEELAFEEIIEPEIDSIMIDSMYVYYKPMPLKIDSVARYLEFPNNDKSIMYDFFENLATLRGKREILRIMHYGDSQIETDRMTRYFRYKLQSQFGGTGPGFVSAVQAYDFKSPMVQTANGDWKRYTAYGRKNPDVKHRRYGAIANFCQFSPLIADTIFPVIDGEILEEPPQRKASLSFSVSPYAYRKSKTYKKCQMFLGNNTSDLIVKAYAEENIISDDTLPPFNDLKTKTWLFEESPNTLKFEFEATNSPEFYGFTFDGLSGIAVDNIAMRGSSGTIFTRMDLKLLGKFYRLLNTKLLILQFGGNVIPGERKNYDFYRRSFSYQLRTLKRIAPDMTIILIGPADMSKKYKDTYVSFPNIVLIRDALKKAAFENNCAYWDMYEAMGGKNSMPSWVFRKPPLAEKDFTHFNPRGAKIIAKMFYNALIYEYNIYIKKRK